MNVGSREIFTNCEQFPYVKDSLIAMWDGEWNSSIGVHDPNAQYPSEIVGNVQQQLVGQIAAGKNYFILGNGYLKFTSEAIANAINEGHATIEIVTEKNGSYVQNGGFIALGNSTRGFWAYQQTVAFLNAISYHSKVSGEYDDIGFNASGLNTVSFMLSNQPTSEVHCNGKLFSTFKRYSTDCDSTCYIGTIAGSWLGIKANAKVYSIRVYDRILSSNEILKNCAVDAIRFKQ